MGMTLKFVFRQLDEDGEDTIRPGSTVSGTVVHMKEKSVILDVALPKGFTKGVLTHNHLSDNPGW